MSLVIGEFSVLMSVYFKESYQDFSRALKSVMSNSILPSEIVLVKDGVLTDKLEEVISDFIALYPTTLKVISLQENKGLGQALRIGLEACNFNLVARMDTDDIALEDRFQKQLNFFNQNPSVSVLGGSIGEFKINPFDISCYRKLPQTSHELSRYLKFRSPFNHMTVMFRKADVIAAGSYQDFFYQEDYFLWLRMHLYGFEFANLSDVLVLAQAGNEMLGRRSGFNYVKSESKLLRFMYSNNILNLLEYYFLLIAKSSIRLIGPKVRGLIYKWFLRS